MAAAGLTLVAATAVGCSDGSGDGGADSSVTAFCGSLEEFRGAVDAADADDLAAYIPALKDAAGELAGTGLPDEMPGEAEQGFELTIARIVALADDATQQDVAALGDVTDEEQRSLDALERYIESACAKPEQRGT